MPIQTIHTFAVHTESDAVVHDAVFPLVGEQALQDGQTQQDLRTVSLVSPKKDPAGAGSKVSR